MERIRDYEILEKKGETRGSLIYRGRKSGNKDTVIIKKLRTKFSSPSEIARFKQEFEIIKNLDIDGIIKPHEIINYENGFVLVLEDFNGMSIKEFLQEKETFETVLFLEIGIKILNALGKLHNKNIIHKDIKPSNILINQANGIVKITDFGISSILTHENEEMYNPDVIQGSLLYISPEQTGRMNRIVDYRTDMYSLGVTFYKMLTGIEPFRSKDPLEIIHSHLAKEPVPPAKLKTDIPEIISDIILKLMSKNAEDRYQSSFGLMFDFEECLKRLDNQGRIEPFELAKCDISGRFIIPQKLFGRENDKDFLITTFKHFREKGQSETESRQLNFAEIMLVAGAPGIGKSALINEINKPVAEMRGYFLSGKYEQFRKDTPYSAIIHAFQKLLRQILAESDEHIKDIKRNLLEALGSNAKIIIDIIPELEHVIGKQPEVVKLGPNETRNRFIVIFERFVKVFTKKQHPIVLFLDDLQWADPASLQLIKNMIVSPEIGYLFLIGSYRDNEVSEKHLLTDILKDIKENGIKINKIILSDLTVNDIKGLIVNFLKCSDEKGHPLAELIYKKTGGNPFFVNEFLHSLYNQNLIKMDPDVGWNWDVEKINSMQITKNLVEFLSQKINKLPERIQDILKICACIGNRFDLETVSILVGKSLESTLELLTEAMDESVISITDDKYIFSHNRIQEAAYSLVPDDEKASLHYMIGKLMLEKTGSDELFRRLFYIVDQLNLGKEFITDIKGKEELARLNYDCGIKAKSSSAFQQAFQYYETGMGLLEKECWKKQYDLTLALHTQAVETAYLNGDYNVMNQYASIVLDNAKNILDTISVYVAKIQAYDAQLKFEESVDICLDVLNKLNHPMPKYPGKLKLKIALLKIKPRLSYKKIDDLYDLPEVKDRYLLSLFTIFHIMTKSSLYVLPDLYIYSSIEQVKLSMQYGLCKEQSLVYIRMANILINVMGDIDAGYKLGNFGLDIINRFNARDFEGAAYSHFYLHISHWKDHLKSVRTETLKSYYIGMETGDLETTAISIFMYDAMGTNLGSGLAELEEQMIANNNILEQLKQRQISSIHLLFFQMVLAFLGKNESPSDLTGTAFDREQNIAQWKASNARTMLGTFYIYELFLKLIFNDYRGAVIDADNAVEYLSSLIGGLAIRDYFFYGPLVKSSLFAEVSRKEQREYIKFVKKSLKHNRHWAIYAPMNYESRIYILEAEKARIFGKYADAELLYDRAIESSRKNEYLVEESLANELAGRYYISRNKYKIAIIYLQDAYICYSRWGATAKLKQFEEIYPELLSTGIKTIDLRSDFSPDSTTGTSMQFFDFTTVVKASQAISNEVVLGKLLVKMMKIVLENAGAQKGFMILKDQGDFLVEAEGTVKSDEITVLKSIPVEKHDGLCSSIVNYVARTNEMVILNDASAEGDFINDPFIKKNKPKSILCLPIINQGILTGILYLENDLSIRAFTSERCEILNILSSQIAISIENAKFYEKLEGKVRERTEELEKSEKRFKDLVYSSADWIWESNIKGDYTYCSEKVENILGYKPEEMIGKKAYNFMPEGEEERVTGILSKLLHKNVDLKDFESWHLTKSGERVYTVTNAVPIFDGNGKQIGYRGVDKDITEYKHNEMKIQGIMNELSRSNQELQQFAYTVSHDLQEPLRKVKKFGDKLKENSVFANDEKSMDYLQRMQNAAERMASLIFGLLNYSRVTTKVQPFKDVDLNSIVNDVLLDLEIRIKETGAGIEISDLPVISADGLQMRQLFQNLIGNALKFQKQNEAPVIKIYSLNESSDNYHRIAVEDNGIGIEKQDHEKIFWIFQRLHGRSEYEGTGIGLAICKKIVERHNGKIDVESSKGKETKFIISFPIK